MCRLSLSLFAMALWATPALAQPPNTTYYTAIAFSDSTGAWGYSYGFLSDLNAKREAIKRCKAQDEKATDARVILLVGNGYAALAKGDDTKVYGYGYSEDADEACQIALRECNKRTKNAKIVAIVHSWAGMTKKK
jgi:hypothetical protein